MNVDKPKRVFVLFDRSVSMSYGITENKMKEGIRALLRSLSMLPKEQVGFVILTFDHLVEAIPMKGTCGLQDVGNALSKISERGLTNIALAIERLKELTSDFDETEAFLVTDGRVNFGLSGGGAEGDRSLREEVLRVTDDLVKRGIPINVISVGEDSFDSFLRSVAFRTGGSFSYSEEYKFGKPLLTISSNLYGIPEELPAGQPTWVKELNTAHVVVTSNECAKAYVERRLAFLVKEGSDVKIRVPLMSIEEDFLDAFRKRLPIRTEQVRRQRAILVDAANRRALDLKVGDVVRLEVH